MPLPPLRPLHPAWPMAGTIAFLGVALTGSMAGSSAVPLVSIVLAGICLLIASRAIRRTSATK